MTSHCALPAHPRLLHWVVGPCFIGAVFATVAVVILGRWMWYLGFTLPAMGLLWAISSDGTDGSRHV